VKIELVYIDKRGAGILKPIPASTPAVEVENMLRKLAQRHIDADLRYDGTADGGTFFDGQRWTWWFNAEPFAS